MKLQAKKDYDYTKIKQNAKIAIDRKAEAARAKIATPGSIQSSVYREKLEEARNYLNGVEDDFVLLSAELEISKASDMEELANIIVTNFNNWKTRMAKIEKIRPSRKAMIDNCENDIHKIESLVTNTVFT